MTTEKMIEKIEELNGWNALIEDAQNEAEAIKDELKAALLEEQVDEVVAGKWIVRYQNVVSNKFNSSAFKKEMPEIYQQYIRQSSSMRFSIA